MEQQPCETLSPAEPTLIVGLGNPGDQYKHTRHNAGFQIIDCLAQRLCISVAQKGFWSIWGEGCIEGCRVVLVKPLTFMNRSGTAVMELLSHFAIPVHRMLVLHDDLDLPFTRIKLVRGGGAGGHRGVLSIIERVGDQSFPRLKLGIGRPAHEEPIEEFVLQPPYSEDQANYKEMIVRGGEAVIAFVTLGLEAAANHINRRE